MSSAKYSSLFTAQQDSPSVASIQQQDSSKLATTRKTTDATDKTDVSTTPPQKQKTMSAALVRSKWKKAFNVIRFLKQQQKVRFIIDPSMNEELEDCPIEVEYCTVDESLVHYVDSITKQDVAFSTKERYFWDFLNSNIWSNRIRITKGKLQTTIMDCLKSLHKEGKAAIYESVKYSTSGYQMKNFMRRGTLTSIVRQYNNTPKEVTGFRSTIEYYCQLNTDIFKLYPSLTVLSRTTIDEQTITVTRGSHTSTKSTPLDSRASGRGGEKRPSKEGSEQPLKNYFIPRVNSSFMHDLLECLSHFKVTRESVTNSKTWHTVREIVICKL